MPKAKCKPMSSLSVSRMDGCQSMMKSILDSLRLEPWPKMWQKFDRLSWKTDDEWFTMFATLSDCRMERASEFCWMSSTCSALQQNLSQGCWAVIKRNTALLSALCSRNGPKNDPNFISDIITGDKSWVFGYNVETKQQSSQRKTPTPQWPKEPWQVRKNVKSMLITFFFLNWRHCAQGICSMWTAGEWKIILWSSEANEGKHLAQTSWQVAQLPGPASQRSCSRIAHCPAVFGFYENDSHPLPSPLTGLHSLWYSSYSWRWNWSSRGDF